jgi:hypothetical protein
VAAAVNTWPGQVFNPQRSLTFAPGTYVGYRFNGAGAVTGSLQQTVSTASSALANRVAIVPNQSGSWYFVTTGVWAGYWVGASAGTTLGPPAPGIPVESYGPYYRPLTISPGPFTGYRFDTFGNVTASLTLTLGTPTVVSVMEHGAIPNRPGFWYFVTSGAWTGYWVAESARTTLGGLVTDIPVPADYDGNGTTDLAVWRPSNGTWYVHNGATTQWGEAGDVPVPADYDGNGTTDLAVWRPSNGTWYVRNQAITQWGEAGDKPVPADYDGNGTTDLAVWRPANGTWYVRNQAITQWGWPGDVPVPADYDDNGTTDLAVWRPSNGTWYVRSQSTTQWGEAGDAPV